jgi:hypothetical protein
MTITLTREEAQQILDALNSCGEDWVADGEWETRVDDYDHELVAKAKELFNAKIAQPEPEPVAWTVSGLITDFSRDFSAYQTKTYTRPLYNAPPTARMAGADARRKNGDFDS